MQNLFAALTTYIDRFRIASSSQLANLISHIVFKMEMPVAKRSRLDKYMQKGSASTLLCDRSKLLMLNQMISDVNTHI